MIERVKGGYPMAVPQNFRNALNGFNKEDVVRYLEYLNTKNTNQVNQLMAELEELRAQLDRTPETDDSQQHIIDALQKENDELTAKLKESEAARSALEEKLAQPQKASAAASASMISDELAAYRRAERTEREARERAAQVYHQANRVLTDASANVDGIADEFGSMVETIVTQLEQLQSLVSGSKQALHEAGSLLETIRPAE